MCRRLGITSMGSGFRPNRAGRLRTAIRPIDDLIGRFAAPARRMSMRRSRRRPRRFRLAGDVADCAGEHPLQGGRDSRSRGSTRSARDLTREEGKTLKEGIGETTRAVQILRYFAGEAQQPTGEHTPRPIRTTLLYTVREPLGVCAMITPWNFPIAIPAWKIAPGAGLRQHGRAEAGQLTPLCAVRLIEVLHEAGLPEGVRQPRDRVGRRCRRSAGAGSAGGGDLVHRLERGRQRVCKKIAAERGAKMQLEMGGKNPAIVLADADLDHAIDARDHRRDDGAPARNAPRRAGRSSTGAIVDQLTEKLRRTDRADRGRRSDARRRRRSVRWSMPGGRADRRRYRRGEVGGRDGAGRRRRVEGNGLGEGHFVAPTLFAGVDPIRSSGRKNCSGRCWG